MGNLSPLAACHASDGMPTITSNCLQMPPGHGGCVGKFQETDANNMQLLRACEQGDMDSIILALAAGANIETRQLSTPASDMKEHDDVDLPCSLDTQETVTFKDGAMFSVHDDSLRQEVTMTVNSEFAPADQKMPGLTPLMCAAKGGKAMAVALLLDARASPNSRDELGMQPLHLAASVGCRESCRYLIGAGACPSTKDEARRDVFACLPHHCVMGPADRIDWAKLLQISTPQEPGTAPRGMMVVPL